jgi:hypothetical protein
MKLAIVDKIVQKENLMKEILKTLSLIVFSAVVIWTLISIGIMILPIIFIILAIIVIFEL